MMLKLTIKDILRQRKFGMIGVISGVSLGTLYYFLTLEMGLEHMATEIELLPMYMAASITLTAVVAILAGINIALVAYNIKTQRDKNVKSGRCHIWRSITAFTPGCPACTTSLTAVLGIVGGLAIFPLQGLELKFISIGALTFSIWWAMRNINKASCCVMKE